MRRRWREREATQENEPSRKSSKNRRRQRIRLGCGKNWGDDGKRNASEAGGCAKAVCELCMGSLGPTGSSFVLKV